MYASWGTTGFQMDLAIFPVITTGSGVQDYFIDGIKLGQNQPNPATSTTMIQYEVQNSSKVSLDIYDITGRLVLTMDEGNQMAGKHSIVIDANKLQAGSYFYSLKAGDKRLTKQMVIE
jgi:flagellar hook assembly protein FlgD